MSGKFVLKIEKSPVLHTKWGTAKIHKHGYYQITTAKEGNYGKRLHSLIFENNYGSLNDDEVCHHLNGCKTDNCICNLERMKLSEHSSEHNKGENNAKYWLGKHRSAETKSKIAAAHKGKTLSEEHKVKLSEANTGKKHPQSKYHNLWNNNKAEFLKSRLFIKNGGIGKCFNLRYNGKHVNCGGFIDPISCEIIHDLIKESIK